jgi:RNA polymerase sigma-70 factor (ECF subfamily)
MGQNDTTLGGSGRSFPSTHWSWILEADDLTSQSARERLDALLRAYWKPAYTYVRVAWRKSNEDAKDLTQAFFARLLENGRIGRIDSQGGRFRSYLKKGLKNFLIDADRARSARQPLEDALSLDVDPGSPDRDIPLPEAAADRLFNREWLSCLLDRSIARLEAELRAQGKESYFKVFRNYLLEPAGEPDGDSVRTRDGDFVVPTYRSVALRFGLTESDVRNYLTACRSRLRDIMKSEVEPTVEDSRDAEAELRNLLDG